MNMPGSVAAPTDKSLRARTMARPRESPARAEERHGTGDVRRLVELLGNLLAQTFV
jgi:hypothetical protein